LLATDKRVLLLFVPRKMNNSRDRVLFRRLWIITILESKRAVAFFVLVEVGVGHDMRRRHFVAVCVIADRVLTTAEADRS
jgi:hypothetical protein